LDELHVLAEQGHDESQFTLGYMYASGKGITKDVQTAKAWLEEAARANNPRAQYYLGELYNEAGKSDPISAYAQMAYWWGRSATHTYWETIEGYDGRAISMRRLAWLHMHSNFDAANPEEALRLLEKLTTKFSSPRSAIELGIVYSAGSFMPLSRRLGGTPIEKDAVKGIRLIERGVLIIENGSNDIDYNLYSAIGDTYLMRKGSEPIATEALHKGIIYKKKALERATGVNGDMAYDLQSQIAQLESLPEAQRPAIPPPAPAAQSSAYMEAPLSPEMEEKFARFSEYFDGLDVEGKRDFIKNLDNKLQENPNPDYNAFLLQCIEKYNAATQGATLHGHETPHAPFGGDGYGHADASTSQAAFQEAAPDAHHHGEHHQSESAQHYAEPEYDDPDEPHPLGKYTDRIHSFGVSSPFLIGTVLLTIGGLVLPIILGTHIYHRFGFLGFAAILFTTPPIVAMWLIYAASKVPKPSEKTLTGLMLFRLTFFLHLILIAATSAGFALRLGTDGQALFGLSIFDTAPHLLFILIALAVIVLYVTFYYGSLFSILKGIRENIYSNMFDPLTGLGAFNAIHTIVSILIIIGSGAIIADRLLVLDLITLPDALLQMLRNENIALSLIAITLIISRIGGLITISVLKQFNSGLEYDLEEVAEEYGALEEYS